MVEFCQAVLSESMSKSYSVKSGRIEPKIFLRDSKNNVTFKYTQATKNVLLFSDKIKNEEFDFTMKLKLRIQNQEC